MKKELQEKLVANHPIIFKDYGGDITQTCMGWGVCCGDGWFTLINELCNKIENTTIGTGLSVVATQIKEKFGGLRFYYRYEENNTIITNTRSNEVHKNIISSYVEEAERSSYKICERCGNKGKKITGGWIRTLCPVCEELYVSGSKKWENLK